MIRFYKWLLPFLVALASLVLVIDREYFNRELFINRPLNSALIIIVILIFPMIVYFIFHSSGSISKTFRLFAFRVLRARVFALFGAVALAISLTGALLGLLGGVQIQTVLLGSFVLVNVVLFYLLALVRTGTFQIREPGDFLYRCENRPEVYLYVDGVGRHIPDPQTLYLLGWSFADVVVLEEKEFSAFGIGRPIESVSSARLVCPDDNRNEVWMILENERRLVPDARILTSIQRLNPQRTIDNIPRDRLQTWQEEKPLASVLI